MSLEVTTNETGLGFPKLMKHTTGSIVLFKTAGTGTILDDSDPSRRGEVLTGQIMANYQDFHGEVTLSQ